MNKMESQKIKQSTSLLTLVRMEGQSQAFLTNRHENSVYTLFMSDKDRRDDGLGYGNEYQHTDRHESNDSRPHETDKTWDNSTGDVYTTHTYDGSYNIYKNNKPFF